MYTIQQLQEIIENEIAKQTVHLREQEPAGLYEPVIYTLDMGGKRLRPVMLLLACNLFSEEPEEALPAALAIEIFHNFTLLHDDIMDKAEIRRNRPTVHVKYNENNAILSGDVMSFLAYRFLLKCNPLLTGQVLDLFTTTAVEVCEGQQLDMDFENCDDVTEEEYIRMIKLKTAVLLGCSLKVGALLGNADPVVAGLLYDYGLNLGLAFQLQDDLLDTFGDQDIFGKKIGGDIVTNKKTFLLIKAMEKADKDQKNRLNDWIKKPVFDSSEKIEAVKSVFNELKIEELTRNKIDFYFGRTIEILESIGLNEKQKFQLEQLNRMMIRRKN